MAIDKVTSAALETSTNQPGFRNIIINGDMSIAQRGTSTSGVTSSDGYYACDRWYSQTDIGTWTISQSTDVPSAQGFAKSMKFDCTTADASPSASDKCIIQTKFEGKVKIPELSVIPVPIFEKAVLSFLDAVSEKQQKGVVSLTAARGRGKSASIGLCLAGAIAYGYGSPILDKKTPKQ